MARSGPRSRTSAVVKLAESISRLSGRLRNSIGTFISTSAIGLRATASQSPTASSRETNLKKKFWTKTRRPQPVIVSHPLSIANRHHDDVRQDANWVVRPQQSFLLADWANSARAHSVAAKWSAARAVVPP